MVVLLKSKVPSSMWYAETWGFLLDGRSRFSVMVAWASSLSHKWVGKASSVLHNPATK
jgi:hypothetical protein